MKPILCQAMYRFLIRESKEKINQGVDPDKVISDLLKALRQFDLRSINPAHR